MTGAASSRGVVGLLTAQAVAFGVMLALLVVPANSLFLDEFGSEWLPVSYIAIAVVGSGAAALIARAARGARLVRVATVSLGAIALVFAASWVILVGGGEWVSAVLLVMFPIAIQVGFVFLGGQAGRLLDVRQMKELFPRVVSGFVLGFLVGGVLGIPLLALLGSTENLLVATTVAQLAFLGLLLLTERRFPEVRASQAEGAPEVARPPLRTLFTGLVALLLAYQVLSAMGSQVVDFLLFDRAAARYSGSDLTRFLAAYTAVLNLVDILFLAVLAGPLIRRFGLRLGLVLNPAVVAAVLAVMAVVAAGPGTASLGLFVLAAWLRIADLAATDGTTRTSINAAYQVVPVEERLSVQAVVEGIGVPVAIGATGVLLLVLDAFGLGVGAVIVFGLLLSVLWTAVAVSVYRSYTRALAGEMRRRPLVATGDLEAPAVGALLASDDARDVRLGLDLLAGMASPAVEVELRRVAEHSDPDVRLRVLGRLAALGDGRAAAEAGSLARDLAHSVTTPRTGGRRPRARIAGCSWSCSTTPTRRCASRPSMRSRPPTPATRKWCAGSSRRSRTGARPAGRQRRSRGSATTRSRSSPPRSPPGRRRLPLVRAAAAVAAEHGAGIVAPALGDPDRSVVLAALDAVDAAGGREVVDSDVLGGVFDDAAALAARALAARTALADRDGPLIRALDDEIELARRLVVAVLALRHGERIRAAVRVVDHGEGARRALGVEALDVVVTRAEAAVVLPLVRHDLTPDERAARLRHTPERDPHEWIADMTDDPEGMWRSSWVAACAHHAAELSQGAAADDRA